MGGRKRTRTKDPTIAIIHANGIIVSGRSGEGLFGQRIVGAKTLVKSFERVRKDDNVKAVILRIDSPGGSALASELIYQAVERCSREKPVVASIAQTGASGGYYIAVGAKTIVADKSAIVGSIGVMSGKLAISGLLEKLGITTYELTRGRNAGIRMSRPWTQREQAVIRKHAERTYDVFVRRVGESRGERVADLDAVAQGRVFTARQAKTNGLIDHLGGLNEALRIAKKAAGVTRCHFITLPEPKTLMDFLAGGEDTKAPQMILAEWMLTGNRLGRSKAVAYLVNLAAMLKDEGVLAAMPSYLSVGQ